MAKITIDGREFEFADGMNLFDACEIARGEKLPHFCYHRGLSVVGVCRMCQVEVEGAPKLMIACNATVREGMVVHTRSPKVNSAVRQILNFHLLHHPVDCPVCDQAGECSLQDFYMTNGLYDADIDLDDKLAKDKVKPIGELVMLDAERCVLCARCTRFTSEITRTHELGIFHRGNHSEIDVAPGKTLDNNYSLNTVDICPVGALTSRDFRFKRRVWWLKVTDGVCPGCATGCNMEIHHSEGVVYRFKPRENQDVNDFWMCDHGRLLYHRIGAEDRLAQPLIKEPGESELRPSGWDQALAAFDRIWTGLGEKRKLVVVASGHATLEEQYALGSVFAEAAKGTALGYRLAGTEMGEADDLLLSADRTPNAQGARRLGFEEFTAEDLQKAASPEAMLVVLDNDLAGLSQDAARALAAFGAVVYLGERRDATCAMAHVALPVLGYAEKDGIFVNGQGRAQVFRAAVAGPGSAKPALRVIAELGELLGHAPSWSDVESVRTELVGRSDAFAKLSGGIDALGVALDEAKDGTEVGRA